MPGTTYAFKYLAVKGLRDKEKRCDEILNMADQGAALLVSVWPGCWVNKNYRFQLFVLKYMLTFILIIEIDNTRHLWQLGRLLESNFAKNMFLGGMMFSTQIKPMESSKNIQFAYNVA